MEYDAGLDIGSIGWVEKHFVYRDIGCRGWWFTDPTHRRHDNCVSAHSHKLAGLAFVLHEMTIVTSIGNAPWKRCGHFGKMADAAREYFDNFDSKDALFLALYPRITFVLVVADSFGTEEDVAFEPHLG